MSAALPAAGRPRTGRMVLATTLWRRPSVTEIVLRHYGEVRSRLRGEVDLVLLAAGSEGRRSREASLRHGFHYLEHPNRPVTRKWNAVVGAAARWDPEGVVLVNSDDVVAAELFPAYLERLRREFDFFGLRDSHVLHVPTARLGTWPGYQSTRLRFRTGEPAGCARCFSRRLLDSTAWRLWSPVPAQDDNMDYWCTRFVELFGHRPRAWAMEELGAPAVQLKTDVNLTPFGTLPLDRVRRGEAAWAAVRGVGGADLERRLRGEHARLRRAVSDGAPGGREGREYRHPDRGRAPVLRLEDLEPAGATRRLLAELRVMERYVTAERAAGGGA